MMHGNPNIKKVDLSVLDFIKWLMSSNIAAISFVFKDMFYRGLSWLCYCLLVTVVHILHSIVTVVVSSILNRRFGYSLISPY